MKYGKWVRNLTFVAISGALFFQSCRRENGIDNNNIISTPYTLYYGDVNGGIENTNDGSTFKRVFAYDGVPVRALVTSGKNVLFVKNNTHLSVNNGQNFNPTEFTVSSAASFQSLILDVPAHNRLYQCSSRGQGIIYSEDNGVNWNLDGNFQYDTTLAYPTSLAQLKGGDLFAYSRVTNRLFIRVNKAAAWTPVPTNGLPGGNMFISRLNDALIASRAGGGVYFSNDKGNNWVQYGGLATGEAVYAAYAPFDQTLLAGTSKGIYRLVSGSFVYSNNGLAPNTKVYSITAKSDSYKNEVIKQYVFIGTSTGLYRSEDLGQNWIMVKDGDIRRVY